MSASIIQRPKTAGSDFGPLNRQIVDAGLHERQPAHYAVRMSVVTAMFAGSWTALFVIGASWWTVAVAGVLGVVLSQVVLLAHDVAHRQVSRTKKPSQAAGRIAANVAVGMSYGW
jgi:fatty acid desaturase